MASIAPQPKAPAKEQFTVRLEVPVATMLRSYCEFIESTQDYVLNQALRLTFEKDRTFQAWLTAQPEPTSTEPVKGKKARPQP